MRLFFVKDEYLAVTEVCLRQAGTDQPGRDETTDDDLSQKAYASRLQASEYGEGLCRTPAYLIGNATPGTPLQGIGSRIRSARARQRRHRRARSRAAGGWRLQPVSTGGLSKLWYMKMLCICRHANGALPQKMFL